MSNLQIKTEDTSIILTATVDQSTGIITFTVADGGDVRNVAGLASLTVSADNYDDVQIKVKVNKIPMISLTLRLIKFLQSGSITFKILNYSVLGEVSFTIQYEGYFTCSYNIENGEVTITGSNNGTRNVISLFALSENISNGTSQLGMLNVE